MEGNKAIRWRRFSHASYSAFCSMHKVINIGVLSIAMIANADAKAKTQHSADTTQTFMSETILDDIEVTADSSTTILNTDGQHFTVIGRQEVKAAAAHSVNDLLKLMPTIDVRQRGGYGIQTDLSIRGASTDQTTLLLNGIDISSPHTGHLSADFPLPADVITKIELSEGGTGTAGTLNIAVEPDSINQADLQATVGLYGLVQGDFFSNLKASHTTHVVSLSANRCDGAVENGDFRHGKLFYLGHLDNEKMMLQWQGGYNRQSFGANTFYSAAFDNQWERTNRLLTSVRWETKTPVQFGGALSWTRSYDHFQLIRDSSYGENYHRTDVWNFRPEASYRWKGGKTTLGVEYKHEQIYSTNLGVPMENDSVKIFNAVDKYYTKNKTRDLFAASMKHNLLFRRWNLNMGVRLFKNFDDDDRLRFLPFINTKVEINRHWSLYASWNNARRTPTFTELFYKSPTNEGNTNLKSEFTSTVSLSAKCRKPGISTELSTYYSHGKDMIDWVMYTSDDIYHSANFQLDNMGFEINDVFLFHEWFDCIPTTFSIGYHFIHQERHDDVEIFKSYYALEYLKHKMVAQFNIQPIKRLELQLSYRLVSRNGGFLVYQDGKNTGLMKEYDPYGILDFKVNYAFKKVDVFGELNNVLNTEYYDFGNVPQPGIVGKIGAKYHFLK